MTNADWFVDLFAAFWMYAGALTVVMLLLTVKKVLDRRRARWYRPRRNPYRIHPTKGKRGQ